MSWFTKLQHALPAARACSPTSRQVGAYLLLSILLTSAALGWAAPTTSAPAQKPAAKADAVADTKQKPIKLKHAKYEPTKTLAVVQTPDKFLNKPIEIEGVFSSFSSLGLDYKKALRPAKQYITLLIYRPDVTHHKIPLGELKLFFPREYSDSVMKLEAGDKISIKGSVFSTALGDPWMDAEQIVVLEKTKSPTRQAEESPLEGGD